MLARLLGLAGRAVHRVEYGRGRRAMSKLRQSWVIFRHPHADIRFGSNVYVGPGFSLDIPANGTFVAGDFTEFRRGFRAEIVGDGRITFGEGSVCTYYVLMQCTTSIDIGERCMFGQSSIVVDGNHRFRDLSRPMLAQGYDLTPITIADDAVVTSKCTIIADLGERAWIGANSVVTRPVPAFCVAGGVPAKVLDYFGPEGGAPPELSQPR